MFRATFLTGRVRRITMVIGMVGGLCTAAAGPIALGAPSASATVTCTPIPETGFSFDGISNLTAAVIDPPTTVTGTIDATGCDVGVYFGPSFTGSVSGATIQNARVLGVANNGGSVSVTNSMINQIGDNPLDGVQYGVGIYFGPSSATGTISGNSITNYQKGGIDVKGAGSSATISNNNVIGQGPVPYIAQNGIEIAFEGSAQLFGNYVTGNWYTGPSVTSCGLLIYKAGGVSGQFKNGIGSIKADNNITGNQTDICNFGKGGSFSE